MGSLSPRDRIIDKAREKLVLFFEKQGPRFARDLERLIGKGVFDLQTIKEALTSLGWDEAVIGGLGEFDKLFKLSENMFKMGEIPFLWTAQNDALFGEFLKVKSSHLVRVFKEEFASSMFDYATAVKLSGKPSKQVIAEATEQLAKKGRRIGTEVDTALSSFDRAAKKMLYENAGIDRFVYVGPMPDDVMRDECRAAMTSPKQQTGWTETDIQNTPGLDMVTGGGYNCRHDWLPFVEGE